MDKVELREPFYSDEWFGICRNRSAVEALRELYQNTNLGEHLSVEPDLSDLDTRDLDGEIRLKGEEGFLSQEQIPAGIPSSHWWWLPYVPPSDSREAQS